MNYPYCAIGVDIGGTKIAAGLIAYLQPDTEPEVKYVSKVASGAKSGKETVLRNIFTAINLVISDAKKDQFEFSKVPLICIGLACAGKCNKDSGEISGGTENFVNFVNVPIQDIVEDKYGVVTSVLNDVQAYALGEARWGVAKGCENVVMLAIGTGVGGAIVVDGKLLKGTHGYAGELGHTQSLLADGYNCPCGRTSHLESVCSGTSIENLYESKSGVFKGGAEISQLAKTGDKNARFAIELSGRALGQSIAMFQLVFDPEMIIVSGSVAKAGKIWWDAVEEGIKEEITLDLEDNVVLKEAKLGEYAPIVGAAEDSLDKFRKLNSC